MKTKKWEVSWKTKSTTLAVALMWFILPFYVGEKTYVSTKTVSISNMLCDFKNSRSRDLKDYVLPPSVTKNCSKGACSLDKTLMNFWKSATLLRVRNSSSLSLRSRGCIMLIMCSLCDHVMHPTVASSVINALLGLIRSSSWTRLTVSLRIRASSNGRTSP